MVLSFVKVKLLYLFGVNEYTTLPLLSENGERYRNNGKAVSLPPPQVFPRLSEAHRTSEKRERWKQARNARGGDGNEISLII